ncbi:hypothetical protein E1B28_011744 [Marasmius oreades]|uniref:Uncharacterized protein n=1 Tax=Marasmius oreades TaxID=181124 RepID=A0A9P7URI7_9AGAR|nr:uncharacterized protein E1B28_011744 [Marasmius oreades]KAG7090136.1 hypothetical protein E1B28_011744 [Marasmius oreades]
MDVLTGASKVKVCNGNFSSIGRDYYTNQTTIVRTRDKKRKIGRGISELSEFTEIKRGDIYKNKDICYHWRLCSNGPVQYISFHALISDIFSCSCVCLIGSLSVLRLTVIRFSKSAWNRFFDPPFTIRHLGSFFGL